MRNGIHILPSLEPWIATFNAWAIDVEGEFVKFEVQDIDNEVHPDPIFGHEAQVYVREKWTESLIALNKGLKLEIIYQLNSISLQELL